jgi:hypothetical protein
MPRLLILYVTSPKYQCLCTLRKAVRRIVPGPTKIYVPYGSEKEELVPECYRRFATLVANPCRIYVAFFSTYVSTSSFNGVLKARA